MDFTTRYKKLNTNQQQAVDTVDGPVMVVAGPGTGKTELLSMRAANILRKTDALPQNILCLTFTESGAAAMRQRMVEIMGQDAYKIAIHTFHSFGAEIINQNGDYFYHGASFRAADELNSYELLRGIFDELPYNSPIVSKMNDDYTHLSDTASVISELKKSGLTSDELTTILDSNDAFMDAVEPDVTQIFSHRVSATTLSLLQSLAHTAAALDTPTLPPPIQPLLNSFSLSLARAIDEAVDTGKTTAITAWKNRWFEKDGTGNVVFKARKQQLKLRAVTDIYYQYILRMQQAELYDFDDMILRVVHAMEVFPELLFNLQEKFQYIMVDEFQDTNLAQMRVLHNLTSGESNNGRANIMVVGDDDQAIYSFQGADISNIMDFQHTYRDPAIITLTDNYRSTATVLSHARSVITQSDERLELTIDGLDKTLTAHRSDSPATVSLVEAATPHDERQHIVDSIKQVIAGGEAPGSIAVLARRHHEIVSLLPYFADAGIAVNYERRDNVLELAPITLLELTARVLVALYHQKHSDADSLLPELLAHPAWEIAPAELWKLSLAAQASHQSWMETMAVQPAFTDLHAWLLALAQAVPHTPLEYMIDHIFGRTTPDDCAYISPLMEYFFPAAKLATNPDEYLVYLEALRTIRAKLRDYHTDTPPTLKTLLEFIRMYRRLGSTITSIRPQAADETEAVHLMTAHKSKGLEFDTVYIIGAIDTAWGERVRSRNRLIGYPANLPLAPSGDSLNERLRLFFVAMTRARKNLTISYASSDANGKATLCASFLLSADLTATVTTATERPSELIAAAERRWYEPLVSLSQATMQQLLAPTLQRYKLSATHLNNFLDVSRGGPQGFLMNNLLRFPQSMNAAAAYGSAIHKTLQHAHAHVAATTHQRPIEDILTDFETNLREQHLPPHDYETFLQKGSDALQLFLAQKYDTFSTTQKVELNFAGQQAVVSGAHLTGSLDLVDIHQTEKTIAITDYKTGSPARSWTGKTDYEKIKLHKYRQQLMFYTLLIRYSRDYHEFTVTNSSLQFVEPTHSGEIVQLEATFADEELAIFERLVSAVWHCITTLDLPESSDYSPDYAGMIALEADLLDRYIDN